jgi:hypothetical protein
LYFSANQIKIPWEKETEKPEGEKSSKEVMGYAALKKNLKKYASKTISV